MSVLEIKENFVDKIDDNGDSCISMDNPNVFPFGLSIEIQLSLLSELASLPPVTSLDKKTEEMRQFSKHCSELPDQEKFRYSMELTQATRLRNSLLLESQLPTSRIAALEMFSKCLFDHDLPDDIIDEITKNYKMRISSFPHQSSHSSTSKNELDVSQCSFRLLPETTRQRIDRVDVCSHGLHTFVAASLFAGDESSLAHYINNEKEVLKKFRKALAVLCKVDSVTGQPTFFLHEEAQFTPFFLSYYTGMIQALPNDCSKVLHIVRKAHSLRMEEFEINDVDRLTGQVLGSKFVPLSGCTDVCVAVGACHRPWESSISHIELKSPYKKLWCNESGSNDAKAQLFAESELLAHARSRKTGRNQTNGPTLIVSCVTDMFLCYCGFYLDGKFLFSNRSRSDEEFLLFYLLLLCEPTPDDLTRLILAAKEETALRTTSSLSDQISTSSSRSSAAPSGQATRRSARIATSKGEKQGDAKKRAPLSELSSYSKVYFSNNVPTSNTSRKRPQKQMVEVLHIDSDEERERESNLEIELRNQAYCARLQNIPYLSTSALEEWKGKCGW